MRKHTEKSGHVVMCTAFFPPHIGGIERYVLSISKHLVARGWKVTILTTQIHNTPEHEKCDGLNIVRLSSSTLASGRMPIPKVWQKGIRKSLKAICQTSPDIYVIHTHLFPLSLLGAFIGWTQSKPVLVIGHGTGHVKSDQTLIDFCLHAYEHTMAKAMTFFTKTFYAVSNQAEMWWTHFGVRGAGVIYNGVEIGALPDSETNIVHDYGLSRNAKIIAFAARLLPDKGADTIITVFLKIEAAYPNLYLIIAGHGPAAKSLTALAANHPRIIFMGEVSHSKVLSLLDAADIFAYPTRYPEGLPTCILEAGLMNCAVTATPAGGVKEILIDQEHGLIIENDSQLEEALCSLLDDKESIKKLAEKLRERVISHFNWENISEELDRKMIHEIERRNSKP